VVHTVAGSLGIVLAALYGLRLLGKVFFGDTRETRKLFDLSFREGAMMVVLFLAFLWTGVYPHPIFRAVRGSVISPVHGIEGTSVLSTTGGGQDTVAMETGVDRR
jgi:NADH:ubiquinone oxidoreductase subunit 4 (subunit M)